MATSFTDAKRKAARSVMSHDAELPKKIEGLRSFSNAVVSDPSFMADIVAGVVAPRSAWSWLPGLAMYSSEAGSAEDDARFEEALNHQRGMQYAKALDQAGRERAALARRNEAIQRERQRLYDKYLSDAELFPEPVNFAVGGIARLAQRMGGKPKHARSLNIVKEPGGNWLTGSIEHQISPLRPYGPAHRDEALALGGPWEAALGTPEVETALARNAAINSWLDKQLTRYIRNEMGTARDPVRKLAERGILHKDFGGGDLAKGWENSSDALISETRADNVSHWLNVVNKAKNPRLEKLVAENQWVSSLDPETPIYSLSYSTNPRELGFDHIIDELTNAMNPESGLPRELLLKPESMARLSVPQAVERVAKINAWREAKKAEADAARAMNPATQVVKEYPEQGYRWVELRASELAKGAGKVPEEVDAVGLEAWQQMNPPESAYEKAMNEYLAGQEGVGPDISFGEAMWRADPEWVSKTFNMESPQYKARQALQDALKYEGETMGHCVGGYCPDVVEGRSRIYSLRDAKGQPHVTIEVKPPKFVRGDELTDEEYIALPDHVRVAYENSAITQIKGKANRAPSKEYLPFVQDFVRSGKWSDVGDLQNTGLINLDQLKKGFTMNIRNADYQRIVDALGPDVPSVSRALEERAKDLPSYGTIEDILEALKPKGFASGGIARIAQHMSGKPKYTRSLDIVKEPGGNWLTGSIERQVSPLRNRARDIAVVDPNEPRTVAAYSRADAINSWLDKQLTSYIRNEMGTAKDPVRELAERGILHEDFPNEAWVSTGLETRRKAAGFPEEGVAARNLAKRWENVSDEAFSVPSSAGDLAAVDYRLAADPWLAKVPPETKVQHLSTLGDLEFGHLIDELTNAMNPESGLPRGLLLKPEAMARLSVPQAVERVAKINAWREANLVKARLADTLKADLYKEYPEQGMRWVQLNRQGQFKSESDAMGHSVRGYEPPELGGDSIYGLGGWDAIQSGKAKVYSLRDAKGQPHVTIEVGRTRHYDGYDRSRDLAYDILETLTPTELRAFEEASEDVLGTRMSAEAFASDWANSLGKYIDPNESSELGLDLLSQLAPSRYEQVAAENLKPLITQIKGKGNKAPNPKYLPFVQDFVRSGNWSEVGDLQNTGLLDLQREFGDAPYFADMMDYFKGARYVDPSEAAGSVWESYFKPRKGFASGGLVKPKTTATTYEETPFEADGLRGLSRKYEQVAQYAEGGPVEKGGSVERGSVEDLLRRLQLRGEVNSFKDKYVEGVAGGGNVAYAVTPGLVVDADLSGYKVDTPIGQFKDFGITRGGVTFERGPHRFKFGKSIKGKDWNAEYEYKFAEGGLVYNPDIVDAMADELRAEVYG